MIFKRDRRRTSEGLRFGKAILSVSVLISVFALLFTSSAFRVYADSADGISARSFCLYNPSRDEIIAERASKSRMGMASTTKIMTAIVVIEALGDELYTSVVTVSSEAVGVEGSSVYLRYGERIKAIDLLYALMLASANDAAIALSIHVAGSVPDFVGLMNDKARLLGLSDTHFENPHGLAGDGHYTTAYELALITKYALENQIFKAVCSARTYTYKSSESTVTLVNHNRLLRAIDGAIGVKTGFTKSTGRTLVGAAERNGVVLICVTLSAPDDWNDHKRLFEYGFSLYKNEKLADTEEYSFKVPLVGSDKPYVTARISGDIRAILREGENPSISVCLDRFIYGSVEKGSAIGYATVSVDGKELTRIPIISEESAEGLIYKRTFSDRIVLLWERFTYLLKKIIGWQSL